MNKANLITKLNLQYDLLLAARQMSDYDSAQRICEQLQHTNRQLHLIELQEAAEREGKIV